MRAHFAPYALIPILLAGCAGTDTGNPFTQPVIVDAHSSDPVQVSIRVGEGGAVVDQAWLGIDTIGLVDASDCDATPAALLPALGVADHAEPAQLHVDAEVPESSYCRLTVPWLPATAGSGAPGDVVGSSIYIAGQTAGGTPFVLRSAFAGSSAVVAIGDAFELAPDLGGLFLGFDMATWFGGLDLEGATVGDDGTITIDAASNAELLSVFEDNIAAGVELYRDVNENGQLDGPADERLARGQ